MEGEKKELSSDHGRGESNLQEPPPFRWARFGCDGRWRREAGEGADEAMGGGVARATTVLLWTFVVHFAAFRELWAPGVLTMWPGCLTQPHVVQQPSEAVTVAVAAAGEERAAAQAAALPPKSKLAASWFKNICASGFTFLFG
jgi:hypothetical protein